MDIEKNQRLIKFSNLIKDMVNYKEISDYLLQSRVISLSDHTELVETVEKTGNSSAMEHLTHVLGLRYHFHSIFSDHCFTRQDSGL
jgi:pyruvate/2-oxoglutarate/acetoin dehydrogenase E1 component